MLLLTGTQASEHARPIPAPHLHTPPTFLPVSNAGSKTFVGSAMRRLADVRAPTQVLLKLFEAEHGVQGGWRGLFKSCRISSTVPV